MADFTTPGMIRAVVPCLVCDRVSEVDMAVTPRVVQQLHALGAVIVGPDSSGFYRIEGCVGCARYAPHSHGPYGQTGERR